MKQGTRILTISLISTSNKYSYGGSGRIANVPYIRLQGKWLENLGFKIGDKVSITEFDNELRIKVLES